MARQGRPDKRSSSSCAKRSQLPLLLLIGSRPESHIRDSFNQESLCTVTRRVVPDEKFDIEESQKSHSVLPRTDHGLRKAL